MSAPESNPKPDGKAFDDFFDSIGSKAEQVNSSKAKDATDATPAVEEEEDQKVVDEIESLCMNCHANVCIFLLLNVMDISNIIAIGYHSTSPHSNPFLPRNHHYVLQLPALQFQKLRDSVCWRNSTEGYPLRVATHFPGGLRPSSCQERYVRGEVYRVGC